MKTDIGQLGNRLLELKGDPRWKPALKAVATCLRDAQLDPNDQNTGLLAEIDAALV
jgi:hypothetical protein